MIGRFSYTCVTLFSPFNPRRKPTYNDVAVQHGLVCLQPGPPHVALIHLRHFLPASSNSDQLRSLFFHDDQVEHSVLLQHFESLPSMKKFGNVYLIAAISIIGGGLFGFDISSMSAIIATDPYLCYFNQGPKPCVGPTANVQGGITASMAGGSWLASLFSGFLSDALGRKRTIMIGAVIWVIGCIIVAAAQNIPMLIVGRIINGFCVGICSAQVPVYITEIAPPTKRGRLVGAQQWAITWGIMIMFYISYGCSFMKGTAAFRVPWALQMIPAIILFFGMIVLPESPRWLATKDKWEECEQVLILTHGHGDPNSPWVAREFEESRSGSRLSVKASKSATLSFSRQSTSTALTSASSPRSGRN